MILSFPCTELFSGLYKTIPTAIVCLSIPIDIATKISIPGKEVPQDLHVTLAYIESPDLFLIQHAIREANDYASPFIASITTPGRFDDANVSIYHVTGMETYRKNLVECLDKWGVKYSKLFDFNPHISIAYDYKETLPDVSVSWLVAAAELWAGDRTSFPFKYGRINPTRS